MVIGETSKAGVLDLEQLQPGDRQADLCLVEGTHGMWVETSSPALGSKGGLPDKRHFR